MTARSTIRLVSASILVLLLTTPRVATAEPAGGLFGTVLDVLRGRDDGLHEATKKILEHEHEAWKRREEWEREARKREEELTRESLKREEELARERAKQRWEVRKRDLEVEHHRRGL